MDQPKSKAEQRRETRTASCGPTPSGCREKQEKPKKDKKEKGKAGTGGAKRSKKNKKDAPKPMTRVVIRHLPPTMTEEYLREQISLDGKMPDHDEFYFAGPDWTMGVNASCRAYINFTNPEDIFRFTDSFDGYTFVDNKGMEYLAVVEYAPFQKQTETRARKKDAKCNTIEIDTHFTSFKEALEAEEQEALHGRGTQEFSFKLEQEDKTTTTPLLEFIAQKHQEKKDEKRRKQEEKRKARDEERHVRKNQTSKALPAASREDKAGGEIVVRTVLSRLNPGQNASKAGGSSGALEKKGGGDAKQKDEKDKKARNRKEKDRNRGEKKHQDTRPQAGGIGEKEKNFEKKQDREKSGKKPNREKDKPNNDNRQDHPPKGEVNDRQKKEKERGSNVKSEQASSSKHNVNPSSDGAAKREAGKHSEHPKDTRARAETRLAEQDSKQEKSVSPPERAVPGNATKVDVKKSILTPNVAPFIPKEKTPTLQDGYSSSAADDSAVLPSSASSVGSRPRNVVNPISEEATMDNGKPRSPDVTTKRGEHVTPKAPNEKVRGKLKETREARKIRNKDRPSIAIYQPRKRIVSGGTGKSEEDRGRSDSDRPSDNVSTSAAAAGSEDGTNERRHKLTKKASDRQPRERKNGRKDSTEVVDGSNEGATDIGWWM